MSLLGTEIDGPIVAVRALHFTATAVTAGALMFRAVVAEPALRSACKIGAELDTQIRAIAWIGLTASVVSGMIWLVLEASAMSGLPWVEAVVSGTLLAVLNGTQFGLATEIRVALAALVAIGLAYDYRRMPRWIALGAAVCLICSIAWTGHAGSTPDELGNLHLAADALHLCGAAAWTGGLVSLALLLRVVRSSRATAGISLMQLDAVRRFSSLGMASVAILIISGLVNSWILVGSWRGLIATDYGWILMLKVAIFAIMIMFAAVNRLLLVPRLVLPAHDDALGGLMRNTVAEIALAFLVFAVVGLLGTMHPAAHLVN
jgi:putative copper resistance protein D